MKHNHSIARILMALVIMFGVQTTASAQFGGLLKKAKQAVKDKVDTEEYRQKAKVRDAVEESENNAVNKTVGKVRNSGDPQNDDYGSNDYYKKLNEEAEQEKQSKAAAKKTTTFSSAKSTEKVLTKVAPGEPGEVTIKVRKTGKLLGTYDRAACKLTTADGRTLLFQTDGTVTDGNGKKVGSINGQTFTTPRGEQIRCDEIGIMFVDKKNVGSIQNQKQAILGDGTFIDASDKMNGVVLAYFIFGYLHSNKQLVAIKDGYEAATMTYNPTDEEFYAEATKEIEKRHGSSSSGSSGGKGGDMQFRKNGSIVGRMLADGTVYVGGSIKGKIDGNNNIYVGGHIEGLLRGNEVLKNGHVVGTIDDDGTVRINGHIVGGIDPRTGDVRYNGSIVGRVEPLGDLKKAAVYYFFQFW
ncbi:MAG: hypothetical protein E7107_05245 [Prevotella sp.]|nr:hypothetical protein [Prevotella sp.]